MMQEHGDQVQYSVFMCALSDMGMVYMRQDLTELLNLKENGVLVVDTGTADSVYRKIPTMGAPTRCGRDSVTSCIHCSALRREFTYVQRQTGAVPQAC